MIKEILNSIRGVEMFPIISMVIFIAIFALVIYWVIRRDKSYITKMKNLPLENNE